MEISEYQAQEICQIARQLSLFDKNRFIRKGYGRIFVLDRSRIDEVIATIKEVDEFEFEYLREGFVTAWEGKRSLIFSGKFEIDMDVLTEACWNKGIAIWCVSKQSSTTDADS